MCRKAVSSLDCSRASASASTSLPTMEIGEVSHRAITPNLTAIYGEATSL
jgi:hypothetical protein